MFSKLSVVIGEKFDKFVKFIRGDNGLSNKHPADYDQKCVFNLLCG